MLSFGNRPNADVALPMVSDFNRLKADTSA